MSALSPEDRDLLASLDPAPVHPSVEPWSHLAAADAVEKAESHWWLGVGIAVEEGLAPSPSGIGMSEPEMASLVAAVVLQDAGLASVLAERLHEVRCARQEWCQAYADDLALLDETLRLEALVGGGQASEWHWLISGDDVPEGWARVDEEPALLGRLGLDVIVRDRYEARARAVGSIASVVICPGAGELGLRPWGAMYRHPGAVQRSVREAAAVLDGE